MYHHPEIPDFHGCQNDHMASETRITLGITNDKLAGRIDVQTRVDSEEGKGKPASLQSGFLESLHDHLFHDELVHVLHAWSCHFMAIVANTHLATHSLQWFGMLSGNVPPP